MAFHFLNIQDSSLRVFWRSYGYRHIASVNISNILSAFFDMLTLQVAILLQIVKKSYHTEEFVPVAIL